MLQRFDREGRKPFLLVNYGIHADTVNGDLLSADWPYWMSKTLDLALEGADSMFICGAQGDVGSTNVHPDSAETVIAGAKRLLAQLATP